MTTALTIGLTDAKTNLNKIARQVNATGQSVTVFKHNKPYITIAPASESFNEETLQAIEDVKNAPVYHNVDDFFESLGL